MSVLDNVNRLNELLAQGKTMEALDELYHKDVVVVEGDGEVRNGVDAQKKAMEGWFEMIKETHSEGVGAVTVNEDTGRACIESWVDLTRKDGVRMKMEEVAVQKWENGKIVHERFYYDVPKQ